MSISEENDWVKQVTQQLDDSNESLDYATQLKLQRAREHALDLGSRRRARKTQWVKLGIPAFAVAATVAAITLTQVFKTPGNDSSIDSVFFQDVELLAAEDDLEFIQQIEFYEWLESDVANELES